MATQLGVWNMALLHLGQSALSTTTDDVPSRYYLDAAWANAPDYCLSQGYWNFAMRVSEEDADTDNETIGYQYSFNKPSDIVRLYGIFQDASLCTHLNSYADRAGKWYASQDPIYVQYVSNHATLGGGLLSAWSPLFTDFVSLYLARTICNKIEGKSSIYDTLFQLERKALLKALSVDGMDEPVKYPPRGSWVRARLMSSHQEQP